MPAHSVFTFDVSWVTLGTSILWISSSAKSNTWSILPSTLSFRFLWLWLNAQHRYTYIINSRHNYMQDTCKVHTKSLKGSNIQVYLNLVIFYVFKTGFNQVVLIITILFLSCIFLEKLLKKKKFLLKIILLTKHQSRFHVKNSFWY